MCRQQYQKSGITGNDIAVDIYNFTFMTPLYRVRLPMDPVKNLWQMAQTLCFSTGFFICGTLSYFSNNLAAPLTVIY